MNAGVAKTGDGVNGCRLVRGPEAHHRVAPGEPADRTSADPGFWQLPWRFDGELRRPSFAEPTSKDWPPPEPTLGRAAIVDFCFNLGTGRLKTSILRRRLSG